MGREETLNKTDHYRCRLCGQLSPISATRCMNGSCGARLSLYGEILAGEEEVYTPPAPEKHYCPHCGGEMAAGEGNCPHCGKNPRRPSAGDTTDRPEQKEAKQEKVIHRVQEDIEPKQAASLKKQAARWKLFTILTAIVSVIVVIILAVSLGEANDRADRYQGNYYDIRYDYNKLSDDYDDLKDAYDAWQAFISNNGLDGLYSVKVTGVFNADAEGKKINDDLTSSKMDRLAIGVDITAADVKNRWAEPLQIALLRSGEEVTKWTIDPGKKYGDEQATVGWKMWTLDSLSPGTYVAEFRHKEFVILRREIVVK